MQVSEFHRDRPETVLLVHGQLAAGWSWRRQTAALADWHVVVPDLPGFGGSARSPWISLDDAAEQLTRLICERAHGGSAHVVGIGLGAAAAIRLAVDAAQQVDSLFLASPSVAPDGPWRRIVVRASLTAWDEPWTWRRLAAANGLRGAVAEDLVRNRRGVPWTTAHSVFDETRVPLPDELLACVVVPVLAVAGALDGRRMREDSLRRVYESMPAARIAIAPRVHRQWNLEHPSLFNLGLREWLAEQGVSGELHQVA